MPIILATQETEIRRILIQRQIVHETLVQKNPSQKRAGGVGVVQGAGLEFKPHHGKKKKKKNE
jgi:hypothetical protein